MMNQETGQLNPDEFGRILENPTVQELVEKAYGNLERQVKIPFVMKDKILMSPGVWNNFFYDKHAINNAFGKTEWNQRNRALFLDHVDDRASEWIGEVTNIHMTNGNLLGDLVIVDKPTAIKLAYGAKFGVSPKVVGEADWNRRINDFHFENFSVVINPAVKTTFLNQQIKFGGIKMKTEKELQEEEVAEEEPAEEETEEAPEEGEELKEKKAKEAKESIEKLAEKVAEILAKKKKKPEEEEMAKKKKPEEEEMKKKKPEEEEMAKKKYPYPYDKYPYPKKAEEMSDAEFDEFLAEVIENSAWTKFVAAYMKKHKGEAPVTTLMKRAAVEYKKQKSEVPGMEEVKVKRMTTEDVTGIAHEVVEQKMAELMEPGISVATRYLNIPTEKQTDGDLDGAICELLGRFAK